MRLDSSFIQFPRYLTISKEKPIHLSWSSTRPTIISDRRRLATQKAKVKLYPVEMPPKLSSVSSV
jgi:hypothetical protein